MEKSNDLLKTKLSDELLIRIAESHLAFCDYGNKIKYLEGQIRELIEKMIEIGFVPISLIEQKGDLMVGKATYRILMDNLERLPQSVQDRLKNERISEELDEQKL